MTGLQALAIRKRQLELTPQKTRDYWGKKLFERQVENNEKKRITVLDKEVQDWLDDLLAQVHPMDIN